jgi:hypothetical protein
MDAGPHHERVKDHVHEDGTPCIFEQRVIPPCALRTLPVDFGLEAAKPWYTLF